MMTRKSLLLTLSIALFLAGGLGTGLVLLLKHEPKFYLRAGIPPGPQRKQWNDQFIKEFTGLLANVLNGRDWDDTFRQEWVNSYFADDYLTKHSAENPLPPGISEPRISLEKDYIRLGFRYGKGPWSTVISLTIRLWLVGRDPSKPNTVALEFESLHAGALPISAQSLLQRIADFAHQNNIDPTWYRRNGHPVLILSLEADRSRPTFLLQQLKPATGMLRISGHDNSHRDNSRDVPSTLNAVSLNKP